VAGANRLTAVLADAINKMTDAINGTARLNRHLPALWQKWRWKTGDA
jgi:hypothetical protein